MRTRALTTALFLIVCALVALALPTLAGGGGYGDHQRHRRIRICHFPPGNPANFQTIVIRAKAWRHHQRHGDLLGSCLANCEEICDDGDPCTQDVESDAYYCACLPNPQPVDCDDEISCTADSCDPVDGTCINVNTCDDGNDCTADLCSNGECTVPPVSGCLFTPVAAGTECDFDGDGIAGDGACNDFGGCESNDPCAGVVCEPLDQCHVAGTCTNGVCDNPPAPDGTFCDDGDPLTNIDVCTAGVCAGEIDLCAGVTCEPLDQCHVAGICTDGICDNPPAPDGTVCDDGDPATTGDVCTAGVCAGTPGGVCEGTGFTCDVIPDDCVDNGGTVDLGLSCTTPGASCCELPVVIPGAIFDNFCADSCVRDDQAGAVCQTPPSNTCSLPAGFGTYQCCGL